MKIDEQDEMLIVKEQKSLSLVTIPVFSKGGRSSSYSGSDNLFGTTSGPEHHLDLLTDIRNFIAFQVRYKERIR